MKENSTNYQRRQLIRSLRDALRSTDPSDTQLCEQLRKQIAAAEAADDRLMRDEGFLSSIGDSIKNLLDWIWGTAKKVMQFVIDCIQAAFDLITSILGSLADCFRGRSISAA